MTKIQTSNWTETNLKRAARRLAGRNISDFLGLCQEFHPLFDGNHAALAAFEMAILDAWSRTKGVPFWELFGKRPRPFSTDITMVIGELKETEAAVRRFYRRGFRVFKIKIGRDPELDFRRVLAVHRLTRQSKIILDANQGFTAPKMLKFLKDLGAHGVTPVLLEQPVPRDDWEGLARLTRESGVLVCADESAGSFANATYAIHRKAASAINIKFMKSGITESLKIVHLARRKGIKLMIGAMMESSLAITAAAHFAGALGCFDFIDLDTTFFLKGPLSLSPYLDSKGRFSFSGKNRPGIGVSIRALGEQESLISC